MTTHKLKCWPQYFAAIKDGSKTFEARVNDRDFHVGDELLLQEFGPNKPCYTGKQIRVRVTYILHGSNGWVVRDGGCVMGIEPAAHASETTSEISRREMDQRERFEKAAIADERAAHASEREWTPKILKRITRNTELSPLVEEFIIHAHNATLQPAHAIERGADTKLLRKVIEEHKWRSTLSVDSNLERIIQAFDAALSQRDPSTGFSIGDKIVLPTPDP